MHRLGLFLGCLGLFVFGCGGGGGGGSAGSAGSSGSGGSAGTGGAGGAGGSMACTEIGCEDGFTLTLKAANGTFADGDYTVTSTVDGAMDTCTITIGAMTSSTCNAIIDVTNMPNHIDILYGGTPMSIDVVVSTGGMDVGNMMFMPMYMSVQPNGPDCPPVCQQASGEITL